MRVEYINPFYQATVDVFRVMLSMEPTRGTLRAVEELVPVSEANVGIGVTGDLRGSLLYSFPQAMALDMVRIMSGMEMTKLDAFVTSALSEVANIISGNALTYLAQNSLTCDISPPQVFIGSQGSMTMSTERAIVLPLVTDIGTLEVTISLHGK
ncbi:MAG TPA: chemotaxis protein CheX [Limnochordia bacterium]|jgi:chemotaxis protein CheX|nr:chemotaxis protein CheX [Limnochordia bacterium]